MPSVIGITVDLVRPPSDRRDDATDSLPRYQSSIVYSDAVAACGATPILLPAQTGHIEAYLQRCDGFILSGGGDPDTAPFGEPVHKEAVRIDPERQRFELALLDALDSTSHPVLGVCLGMQLMVLHHGGRLHQHLPDAPEPLCRTADRHADAAHPIRCAIDSHPYLSAGGYVQSVHHQAVAEPGRMRTIAVSDDGVIEAVDLPDADRFYLGVQWHPERTEDPPLGQNLIAHFITASRQPEH